jgi:hypothetical protein
MPAPGLGVSVDVIRREAQLACEASSLRAVATNAGMSPMALRSFIRGETVPQQRTIRKLSAWYARRGSGIPVIGTPGKPSPVSREADVRREAPRFMTLQEHLAHFVRFAPPGTMIPVDSLAELLRSYEPAAQADNRPGMSLSEVAARFTRTVAGEVKVVKEDTVRKWIRVGLGGVRLKAFRVGRNLRVRETDFGEFVASLGGSGSSEGSANDRAAGVRDPQPATPEDELEAFLTRYRESNVGDRDSATRTSRRRV